MFLHCFLVGDVIASMASLCVTIRWSAGALSYD